VDLRGYRSFAVATPLRYLLAVLLVAHGIAHFVGTQSAIVSYADDELVAYLFGAWEPQGTLLLALAGTWAAAGLVFIAVGVWVIVRGESWSTLLAVAAGGSLILSLSAMPDASIGVVINAVLLTAVISWHRWFRDSRQAAFTDR
jgi:hypothetical protein